MKSVQMVDLGDGVLREIEFINSSVMVRDQIVIELADDRSLSEICADFDGVQTITRTDSIRPEIVTSYEGYTQLVRAERNLNTGTVRLTLRKP